MSKDIKTPKRELLAELLGVKRESQETRRERREKARPVTSSPQILPGDD